MAGEHPSQRLAGKDPDPRLDQDLEPLRAEPVGLIWCGNGSRSLVVTASMGSCWPAILIRNASAASRNAAPSPSKVGPEAVARSSFAWSVR
jgi:hypothetical protein